MSAAATRLGVGLLGITASLALGGCHRAERSTGSEKAPPAATAAARPRITAVTAALAVPHVTGPIKLDGEVDELDWNAAGRTGPFPDATGAEARPYSDARFLWDEENLYVTLYAADDDLRAKVTTHDGPVWIDDSFALHVTPAGPAGEGVPTLLFDISASGVTMDARRTPDGKQDVSWESGIRLGVDRDGTLNDPTDEDEEWVIEAAIPLKALGVTPTAGTRFLVDIARCDTPRNTTTRRCSAWGTAKERRTLELAPRPAAPPPSR